MVNYNEKYHISKYTILERENENLKLVLWPDLPYWLLVGEDTVKLIQNIENHSLSEIIEITQQQVTYTIDSTQVKEFLTKLENSHTIWKGNNIPPKEENFYKFILRYITLNITDTCNLFCKHCYIEASNQKKQFLSLDQVKIIINKLRPLMIKSCSINVSGGEALMNPECIDILNYLSNEGFDLNMVTNGTLITENIAQKLGKIKNLSIQVSLDGASQDVHEYIRGKNTYHRSITGIKRCVAQGLDVSLSPIVSEALYDELEEYFLLAKDLGVNSVFLQPINEVGRAQKNSLKRVDEASVFQKFVELYKKYPDFEKYIPGSLDVQHLTSIRLLEKCLYCGSGVSSLAIQPNGNCYPCPNTIIPGMEICNVLTDDVVYEWFNSDLLSKMRNLNVDKNLPDKCHNCDVKFFCGGGCRGVAIKHSGSIYGMSPECESAYKRYIEMIWTAAKEPNLFYYDVIKRQKDEERLEQEANVLLNNDERFVHILSHH